MNKKFYEDLNSKYTWCVVDEDNRIVTLNVSEDSATNKAHWRELYASVPGKKYQAFPLNLALSHGFKFSDKLLDQIVTKFAEAKDPDKVFRAETWGALLDQLSAEDYSFDSHYYDEPYKWIEVSDSEGNTYEIEITKYFRGGYEILPENINLVSPEESLKGENIYGLFSFTDRDEYEDFLKYGGFTDFESCKIARDFEANTDEEAKMIADMNIDDFGIYSLCKKYADDDYEPLYQKTEGIWYDLNEDTFQEKDVYQKLDDTLFYVVKNNIDKKYLGKNGDDEIFWTTELEDAEAFDSFDDAQDVLDNFIFDSIPDYYTGSLDDETAERCLDWQDEEAKNYSIVGIKADSFHESKLKESEEETIRDELKAKIKKYMTPEFKEDEWEPKDIDIWKSIDWKARNYEDYTQENPALYSDVYLYGEDGLKVKKEMAFYKTYRANPIYPPRYECKEKITGYAGGFFDGRRYGKYKLMDRYETWDLYKTMSESEEKVDLYQFKNKTCEDVQQEIGRIFNVMGRPMNGNPNRDLFDKTVAPLRLLKGICRGKRKDSYGDELFADKTTSVTEEDVKEAISRLNLKESRMREGNPPTSELPTGVGKLLQDLAQGRIEDLTYTHIINHNYTPEEIKKLKFYAKECKKEMEEGDIESYFNEVVIPSVCKIFGLKDKCEINESKRYDHNGDEFGTDIVDVLDSAFGEEAWTTYSVSGTTGHITVYNKKECLGTYELLNDRLFKVKSKMRESLTDDNLLYQIQQGHTQINPFKSKISPYTDASWSEKLGVLAGYDLFTNTKLWDLLVKNLGKHPKTAVELAKGLNSINSQFFGKLKGLEFEPVLENKYVPRYMGVQMKNMVRHSCIVASKKPTTGDYEWTLVWLTWDEKKKDFGDSKMNESFKLEVFDRSGKPIDYQAGFRSPSEARDFIEYNDDKYPTGYTFKITESGKKNH